MNRVAAIDEPQAHVTAPQRGRYGAAMTAIAVAGLAIATYLLAMRVVGAPPACGPVHGCDTVAASEYATVLGLPVALYGLVWSAIVTGACVAWWRRSARVGLYVAYGLGIVGVAAVGYLTYLEIAVIEAICIWCVSYAITVVLGWAMTIIALRSPVEPR